VRFLIWGAGAIGGTLGAHLARSGHDVTLVDAVAEHVDAINRAGLRISGPVAEFTTRLPAFTPEALTGDWNTIVLATKAQHTEDATRALRPHLTSDGCVVSAQNGLNEIAIAEIVGAERTVGELWRGLPRAGLGALRRARRSRRRRSRRSTHVSYRRDSRGMARFR
jgi:2-dehydropantoate 2-reductase